LEPWKEHVVGHPFSGLAVADTVAGRSPVGCGQLPGAIFEISGASGLPGTRVAFLLQIRKDVIYIRS
jgi:hypothetical protein